MTISDDDASAMLAVLGEITRHAGERWRTDQQLAPAVFGDRLFILCRPSGEVWFLLKDAAWLMPYPPGSSLQCYRDGELQVPPSVDVN